MKDQAQIAALQVVFPANSVDDVMEIFHANNPVSTESELRPSLHASELTGRPAGTRVRRGLRHKHLQAQWHELRQALYTGFAPRH